MVKSTKRLWLTCVAHVQLGSTVLCVRPSGVGWGVIRLQSSGSACTILSSEWRPRLNFTWPLLRHFIGSHLFCSCHMYSISLEEDWPYKCATVGVKEFLFWSWALFVLVYMNTNSWSWADGQMSLSVTTPSLKSSWFSREHYVDRRHNVPSVIIQAGGKWLRAATLAIKSVSRCCAFCSQVVWKVRLNEVDTVSCGAFTIHSSLKTCPLGFKHQQSCRI